ncbi:protein kinase domain-containing protein [Sorangium sp. So ce131]|uniref:serine/threonine-protein kinase n=1 Tax=Sorangium sp. So ce131 TaxID=3133282 RepID=UPI003F616E69
MTAAPPIAVPLAPGTVLGGDFRIVRPLSQGGMGAVFVAEQLSTGKPRAVKLMHAQIAQDARFRERFEQEARVGARIESEHVVEVVAAGVDPATQTPWLAMELLDGSDLAAVVGQRGALPPDEVHEMMGQLCHALAAAHRAGVVHRDLKPENVFVARPRQQNVRFKIKVLDFGVAKVVAETRAMSAMTSSVGTPLWMAPEQTELTQRVTPASDVWSLGLIAFFLLTARLYWLEPSRGRSASVMSLMREVLFNPLEPPSARAAHHGCAHLIPPGFDAWFARCVSREPHARFADAGQAMAALDPVLAAASYRSATSSHGPPVPVQPMMPAHSVPAHSMPAHSMPAHSMPAHSMPAHSMPAHSMPAHSMPAHSMPAQPPYTAPTYPGIARTDVGGMTGGTLAPAPSSPPRKASSGLVLAIAGGGLLVVMALVVGGVLLLRRMAADEPDAAPPLPSSQGGPGATTSTPPRPSSNLTSPPTSSPVDVAGTYDITASRNPGGQGSYAGNVLLSRTGDTYRIAWIITKGSGYEGIAFVQDQTLAVGWANGGQYGAAAYRIDGERLHGHWISTDRPGQVQAEELQGPAGLSGSYRIAHGARQGTVLIAPAGETYAVTWTLSTGVLKGVGIRSGDQLVVGWSPGQQVGVVSYAIQGKQLTGRWATLGGTLAGSETLMRR